MAESLEKKTLRAAVVRRFGPPEAIVVEEMPKSEPAPDGVLVQVVAAGVNTVAASNRADGTWAGLTLPVVLGSDAAGIVVPRGDVEDLIAEGYGTVSIAVDFVGGDTFSRALPVVAEGGRVASACALQGDLELREHGHGRRKLVLRIQPERPARRRDANESAA
jgi:NADPH:quinone reductase-like Zn-dependent oxidoreductase